MLLIPRPPSNQDTDQIYVPGSPGPFPLQLTPSCKFPVTADPISELCLCKSVTGAESGGTQPCAVSLSMGH